VRAGPRGGDGALQADDDEAAATEFDAGSSVEAMNAVVTVWILAEHRDQAIGGCSEETGEIRHGFFAIFRIN
jgi:hypothetical protein